MRLAEYSYNGWLASKNPATFGGLQKLVVAGESFAPGVRAGDVHTVLEYVARNLHERVEPVVRSDWHQADDWGFAYRKNKNANNLSCHSSGTAFDYNATRHPNGRKDTFTSAQYAEIDRILAEVDNTVRQLRGYDEMHFEISASQAAVSAVARRLRNGSQIVSKRLLRLTRPNTRGEDVEALQGVLGINVDGVFGPATDRAVREFQRQAGLVDDGIVGPATRRALGI